MSRKTLMKWLPIILSPIILPFIVLNVMTVYDKPAETEASYAPYQEYGTGIYAEAGNGRKTPWVYKRKDGKFITTSGNRPHPFVRPTAREDFDKIVNAMREKFGWLLKNKWN